MSAGHVLPGKDGWLFLGEGSNNSLSQMTGRTPVPVPVQNQWLRALRLRELLWGDRVTTIICAEKSCAYPEYLPDGLTLSSRRLSQVLARQMPGVVYAFDQGDAHDHEKLLYSRTDTHYTDYGAHVAARRICRRLGITHPEPTPSWGSVGILGDLGSASDPQVRSENVVMLNPPAVSVRDNGLRNRGRISVFESGRDGVHVLVFGDSFSGISLARSLAHLCGRVTFVHSIAFDYELIERLQPDFLVGEIAERFLIEPPAEGRTLASLIMEKLVQGLYTEAMLQEFRATLDEFESVYGASADMLRRLAGANPA